LVGYIYRKYRPTLHLGDTNAIVYLLQQVAQFTAYTPTQQALRLVKIRSSEFNTYVMKCQYGSYLNLIPSRNGLVIPLATFLQHHISVFLN
jgi:hypothetical protein